MCSIRPHVLFVFFCATVDAFFATRPPSSSLIRASQLSPEPETRQKQLEFLKARGFVYDEDRGLWTRPPENSKNDDKKRPALVRGGSNRILEVFASDQAKARKAAAEVSKTIRSADDPDGGVSARTSLESVASRAVAASSGARVLLALSQLCLWGLVTNRLSDDSFRGFEPGQLFVEDESTLYLAACAAIFAFCATDQGSTKWSGSGLSGRLEAAAADGWTGAHAVPAPASWRASDRGWRLRAAMLDLLAAFPRCLAFHAAVQAPLDTEIQRLLFFDDALDNSRLAALLAIGTVSLFAVAADLLGAQQNTERDAQRQAEIDALKESLRSAGHDDDSLYADVARAWIYNFQTDRGASSALKAAANPLGESSLVAFGRAAAVASAYRVAGNNLAAPLALHALAALTAVFLSKAPNEDPDRAVCNLP